MKGPLRASCYRRSQAQSVKLTSVTCILLIRGIGHTERLGNIRRLLELRYGYDIQSRSNYKFGKFLYRLISSIATRPRAFSELPCTASEGSPKPEYSTAYNSQNPFRNQVTHHTAHHDPVPRDPTTRSHHRPRILRPSGSTIPSCGAEVWSHEILPRREDRARLETCHIWTDARVTLLLHPSRSHVHSATPHRSISHPWLCPLSRSDDCIQPPSHVHAATS